MGRRPKGSARRKRSREAPCQSLSDALNLLPETLTQSVTIRVAAADYKTTGGKNMASDRLELVRRMRPGVAVRIIGEPGADGGLPHFGWEGGSAMVVVGEGEWWLENVQIGTLSTRQRRGVMVTGPAQITLKDVTFRTRSQSDAAVYAERGGSRCCGARSESTNICTPMRPMIALPGSSPPIMEPCGSHDSESGSLDMGNGSLSASYYGCIGLGCRTAQITSWGDQSNTLAINNGGRIDLHNTTTTLVGEAKAEHADWIWSMTAIFWPKARGSLLKAKMKWRSPCRKRARSRATTSSYAASSEMSIWASSGSMFVGPISHGCQRYFGRHIGKDQY